MPLFPEEINALSTQRSNDVVDQAAALVHKQGDHGANNHGGNKMRRIRYHLHYLFIANAAQFIDQQRCDNGQRKCRQRIERKHQGVANNLPAIGIIEEFDKIL